MEWTMILLIIVLGIAAGGIGVLVGAGGGFIFVPAILLLLDTPPHVAAATGIVIVFFNALFGMFGYMKQSRIDYKAGLWLSIGAIPGSIIGISIHSIFQSDSFYTVFATLLVGIGLFLFYKNSPFSKKSSSTDSRVSEFISLSTKGKKGIVVLLGFGLGVISSFFGIGGGWMLVPILVYGFHLRTHRATATSIFALAIYSSVAAVIQTASGDVDWMLVGIGGAGVLVGSQIGTILSARLNSQVIVQVLSLILIITGGRMFWN
ncbi:sulfite exporter TauE/SafE family protein [Jeotgalibacillus soli]|uniref:Probable membrane transporter protein n=1 Tax=Jeotgalibacillus soli TaxID=889306 RepID=A0A0C2RGV1_9BACL|nr:sulfite exporter TauE/SafE family protein [Jeotgalibacillus soli]KIL49400.1 hypothetical protein KP78_08680 [Jeotgalibacillus soli]